MKRVIVHSYHLVMTNSSQAGKSTHAMKFGKPSNFRLGPWQPTMASPVNVITRLATHNVATPGIATDMLILVVNHPTTGSLGVWIVA